ncbi:helix-turn-helix transcriptional regulator [Ferribacterium limneticum]|uniref:helix-turn-helix transcriptional regulator n=1 Tax=Ferribacterium limneticum TaxID=76259 RepID=UPI001CFB441E|nr:AlpA family phage regulatory protein [Ferribacterium limneticum]UCV19526.1 AlpA family phage regulatory protein [Ferribacterium limneticum]
MNTLLIRMRELSKMLNYGESTLYDKMNPKSLYYDPDFPRPIALSSSPRGAKAWRISSIEAWLELRAQKSLTPSESSSSRNPHDNRDKFEIPPQSKTLGMPVVSEKTIRNKETSGATTQKPTI